jgi:hypothetical protein
MKTFDIPAADRALVKPYARDFQTEVALVANRLMGRKLSPDLLIPMGHHKGGIFVLDQPIVIDSDRLWNQAAAPWPFPEPHEEAAENALRSVIGAFKSMGPKALTPVPTQLLLGDPLKMFFHNIP